MDTNQPKVRLELRKSGKKRKQQQQQHAIVGAFGTEEHVDRQQEANHSKKDDEPPLVIPVAANRPKFITSSEQPGNEEDERAARALLEDTLEGQKDSSKADAAILMKAATNSTRQKMEMMRKGNKDGDDDELYKKEMERLPQELAETDDAYDRVPIADFGAALLRGMGWQGGNEESAAADKTKEKDATSQLPRPHRLGLGAVPKPMEEITHRPLRPDEYEKRKKQRLQHQEYQAQHEKKRQVDPQQTLQNGSIVYLVDSSVRVRIVKLRGVPGLNRIQVQYERDSEVTSIQKSQVDRLVPRQELLQNPFEEPLPMPDKPVTSSTQPEVLRSSLEKEKTRDKKKKSKKDKDVPSESDPKERPWMIPHIRVRIITKKLGKSHYKAKGVVVDVTTKGATLQMPDGSLIDRVPAKYVETALPKVGGSCIIVGRKHWQTKGRLLERNSHKAIIQESENGAALTVHLDDLAEWCGPEEETVF